MPGIVGCMDISIVQNSGNVGAGDTLDISPKNTGESFSGQGSFSTGDNHKIRNKVNKTFTQDNDAIDTSIIGNN